ncbi:MAG: cyclic nucleotide-binding domain-containing protein [Candidatus Limnocylindria bacterium]
MARDERIEGLRRVPLFSHCSQKQLEFIVTRVEELDFPEGRTLCQQGKSGGDFFIILDGAAEVSHDGRRIRELTPGDFFGEIALVDNGPRTATVRAATALRCLVLGPAQFRDVLHQDVTIAVSILQAMAARLRATGDLHAD